LIQEVLLTAITIVNRMMLLRTIL